MKKFAMLLMVLSLGFLATGCAEPGAKPAAKPAATDGAGDTKPAEGDKEMPEEGGGAGEGDTTPEEEGGAPAEKPEE